MTFNPKAGQLALPTGSLILVTGSTGYIATHIIKEALAAGYTVRGTARAEEKCRDDEAFHKNPNYHCVAVEDMTAPGAFDQALKDVAGVIHTASPTDANPDPNKVIPPLVKHLEGLLEACAASPTVKRFVYTSSSTALTLPYPGVKMHLSKDTWNQRSVDEAWTPPHTPEKGYCVYGASKTEAERALWRFVKEKQPKFIVNTICPDTNFGRVLNGRMGPTGRCIPELYTKSYIPGYIPSQYMVNVLDTARLHLIALLDTSVSSERILAFDEIFTWNSLIDIISDLRPSDKERLQILKPKDEVSDATTVDNALGGELLRKWYGQRGERGDGWSGLRRAVEENLEGL